MEDIRVNIIACVDDRMGLLFNNRRQSQDKEVIRKINEIVGKQTLWIHPYSKTLFPEAQVSEEFLEQAKNNEFCFIENIQVPPEKVKKLYLFHWNRIYPSDFSLKLPMDTYKIIQTEDFTGSSHEKITLEVYDCE